MKQKGTYTMLCAEVQQAYKRKNENYLHLITFKEPSGQPYIAEELSNSPVSSFVRGKTHTFEVTHPGQGNKPDWIRASHQENGYKDTIENYNFSPSTEQQQQLQATPQGSDLITAQVAFQCAVQLGIKSEWTEEQIIQKAYLFAGNIKRIAKQIGFATDI